MASSTSKPVRKNIPNHHNHLLEEIAVAIVGPKKQSAKTQLKKVAKQKPSPVLPEDSFSNEGDIPDPPKASTKSAPTSVDVSQCKFHVSCTTIFARKEVFIDSGSYHLGDFKIHECNAKSIKAISREAERLKLDFEFETSVASVFG